MRSNNEFEFSSTPDFETRRLEARQTSGSQSQYAQCDDIAASMKYMYLYGLPVVDLAASPISSAKRMRSDVLRGRMDDFKLLFQVSGRMTLIQNERTTELGAGDLGLVDVTRPIHAIPIGEPGRVIELHLPRQPLIAHLGFEPQGGICWKGRDTLPARLLVRLLEDTIADVGIATGSEESLMQLAIYNLVGALFGTADQPRHFSQGDKLFLRICRIVKRDFSNPNVGPADVAAEAGISVRYLQKIFAMRGTTYRNFLKSFRLNHAASVLDRRTEMRTKLPLVEVAQACGYRDYAHFARDFRARFGQTPGSFNARVKAP